MAILHVGIKCEIIIPENLAEKNVSIKLLYLYQYHLKGTGIGLFPSSHCRVNIGVINNTDDGSVPFR